MRRLVNVHETCVSLITINLIKNIQIFVISILIQFFIIRLQQKKKKIICYFKILAYQCKLNDWKIEFNSLEIRTNFFFNFTNSILIFFINFYRIYLNTYTDMYIYFCLPIQYILFFIILLHIRVNKV